jgi:Domain of unknown function (DUF5658)
MHAVPFERRSGIDRRRHSLGAYVHGARNPRRRDGRRASDAYYPIIDWHSPRVFAMVMAILTLCVADGVLTVFLISHGAIEVNPFMAMFVPHKLGWFAAIKLSLTGSGTLVLVACSRMKLFKTIPGEALLAGILVAYVILVIYELRLVEVVTQQG